MITNEKVAESFVQHQSAKAGAMFSEGEVIYSFGHHFPLAAHLPGGAVLRNDTHYGIRTTRHQSIVSQAIRNFPQYSCTTEEICAYVDKMPPVVILERRRKPSDIDEAIRELDSVSGLGVKREGRLGTLVKDEIAYMALLKNQRDGYYGVSLAQFRGHRFPIALKMLLAKAKKGDEHALSSLRESLGHERLAPKDLLAATKVLQKHDPEFLGLARGEPEIKTKRGYMKTVTRTYLFGKSGEAIGKEWYHNPIVINEKRVFIREAQDLFNYPDLKFIADFVSNTRTFCTISTDLIKDCQAEWILAHL